MKQAAEEQRTADMRKPETGTPAEGSSLREQTEENSADEGGSVSSRDGSQSPEAARADHPHLKKLKRRAAKLQREAISLGLALKDPSTPWAARVAIGAAFAYLASPIDLIPDFIPVLGQLDDLIIPPALLALAIKLIPKETMARCRREAYRRRAAAKAAKEAKAAAATSASEASATEDRKTGQSGIDTAEQKKKDD